ncbi:MAG: hypothetical protein ACRDPA_24285 [Solirubrobacteraceae bacterium]
MSRGEPGDEHVAEILEQALGLAEETLEQIARVAVEQIRTGAEASNHVEAAERDLRSALRQLVLAQRDWRAPSVASASPQPGEGLVRVTGNSSRPRA